MCVRSRLRTSKERSLWCCKTREEIDVDAFYRFVQLSHNDKQLKQPHWKLRLFEKTTKKIK